MLRFGVFLLTAIGSIALAQKPNEWMWRNPGKVEALDLASGAGGRAMKPRPPFRFIEEEKSGTAPKVIVEDGATRRWMVKWGPEARTETFATRLVWAAGYFAQPTWLVRSGRIDGANRLDRAAKFIGPAGGFADGRFQLLYDDNLHPVKGQNWALVNNPFQSKPEFTGLKVMAMLLSNRDVKDARSDDGMNTAILERKNGGRTDLVYAIVDWGSGLGKWGALKDYSTWDCAGFSQQTPSFVRSVQPDGTLRLGYEGKFDSDLKAGITTSDVKWLMRYLGRIRDSQIRSALTASGASPEENRCFTRAMRDRIEQLRRAAASSAAASDTASRYRQSAHGRPQSDESRRPASGSDAISARRGSFPSGKE